MSQTLVTIGVTPTFRHFYPTLQQRRRHVFSPHLPVHCHLELSPGERIRGVYPLAAKGGGGAEVHHEGEALVVAVLEGPKENVKVDNIEDGFELPPPNLASPSSSSSSSSSFFIPTLVLYAPRTALVKADSFSRDLDALGEVKIQFEHVFVAVQTC